jgi:hypothetical protein
LSRIIPDGVGFLGIPKSLVDKFDAMKPFQGVFTDIISADKKDNFRPIRIFRTRAYGVDKSEGGNHHERRYQERPQNLFSIHVVPLPVSSDKPLGSIN